MSTVHGTIAYDSRTPWGAKGRFAGRTEFWHPRGCLLSFVALPLRGVERLAPVEHPDEAAGGEDAE
jgi:hypothetical protein